MPVSLEQLDLLLLTVVKPRHVQRDGIRFQALRYILSTLAGFVGEAVTIRYDPATMAEIRVFHDDRFTCRAICQELAAKPSASKTSSKPVARSRAAPSIERRHPRPAFIG